MEWHDETEVVEIEVVSVTDLPDLDNASSSDCDGGDSLLADTSSDDWNSSATDAAAEDLSDDPTTSGAKGRSGSPTAGRQTRRTGSDSGMLKRSK